MVACVRRTLISIVEGEARRAALVEEGFRASGYATSTAPDLRSSRRLIEARECDLVVVDAGPLDIDDLEQLREIADRRRLPLVFIVTPADLEGRLGALGLAAHEYVTKPFQFDLLLARVQDSLERQGTFDETKPSPGPLQLDPWTRRARIGDVEVPLTGREFTLLQCFLRHPGQVLTRERLHANVWGYEHDPGSNVVEVYVGYLRRKLGAEVIETVRGQGYRLNVRDLGRS
jgi:DNA-binding response OmpR family regulator